MRGTPLLDVRGGDFPQAVDLSRFSRGNSLSNLYRATNDVFGDERIRRRAHLDPNDADAWVILRSVVLAIAQVTKPGLERGTVVLLD